MSITFQMPSNHGFSRGRSSSTARWTTIRTTARTRHSPRLCHRLGRQLEGEWRRRFIAPPLGLLGCDISSKEVSSNGQDPKGNVDGRGE